MWILNNRQRSSDKENNSRINHDYWNVFSVQTFTYTKHNRQQHKTKYLSL